MGMAGAIGMFGPSVSLHLVTLIAHPLNYSSYSHRTVHLCLYNLPERSLDSAYPRVNTIRNGDRMDVQLGIHISCRVSRV
jgi:hypothetical protein